MSSLTRKYRLLEEIRSWNFWKTFDEQLSDGLEQSNLPCFYSYRCQHWGNSCHRHVVTGGSWRHVVVVVEFLLWLNRESCCVWMNKPWERDLEWGSRMVVVVRVDIGRVKKRREEQPLLLLWQKLDVSWWCKSEDSNGNHRLWNHPKQNAAKCLSKELVLIQQI